MTSARLAAIQARREVEFLEIAQEHEEKLAEAKANAAEARESGDEHAISEAVSVLKAAKDEMREFRAWARAFGEPKEGVPGRDAVISMGGAVDGVGR